LCELPRLCVGDRFSFSLCRSIIGGSYPRIAIVNQLGEQLGGDGGVGSVGCAGAGLCRIRSGAGEVRKLFLGPAFDEQGDEVAYPCIGELSSYPRRRCRAPRVRERPDDPSSGDRRLRQ